MHWFTISLYRFLSKLYICMWNWIVNCKLWLHVKFFKSNLSPTSQSSVSIFDKTFVKPMFQFHEIFHDNTLHCNMLISRNFCLKIHKMRRKSKKYKLVSRNFCKSTLSLQLSIALTNSFWSVSVKYTYMKIKYLKVHYSR